MTEAERTLTSIATMLGWEHVPPQHVLEAEIRSLKARAKWPVPSDDELVQLAAHANQATVTSVKVVNNLQRGTEAAACRREHASWRSLLTILLRREPTDGEMDRVIR